VILYEMLSGRVPFDGESAGEILMKHLSTPPDLSKLPVQYAAIVGKALHKNPSQRYANMTELAKAVEGVGSDVEVRPVRAAGQPDVRRPAPQPTVPGLPTTTLRVQIAELCSSLLLSVLFAFIGVVLWATLAQIQAADILRSVVFLTVGACWTVLIPAKLWGDGKGDPWARRLVMLVLGGVLGYGALWLDAGSPDLPLDGNPSAERTPFGAMLPSGIFAEGSYLAYFGLGLFAVQWWRMAGRYRLARFSFGPVLAAGFWAFVLLLIINSQMWRGAVALVLAAIVVQLVSPWVAPPPPPPRRVKLRYA
jgi:hypothetical protein